MSKEEREIQAKIRNKAKEEKAAGKIVKTGLQKLIVGENTWIWNKNKGCFDKAIQERHKKIETRYHEDGYMTTKALNMDMRKQVRKINRKEKSKYIKMGTWNVRGTWEEGKLTHIVRELRKYNFDIVAVQETKQLGQTITEVGGYIFMNSEGKN